MPRHYQLLIALAAVVALACVAALVAVAIEVEDSRDYRSLQQGYGSDRRGGGAFD